MHLDHFQVKVRAEDFGGFLGEPEKGVHTDAIIRREDKRDRSARGADFLQLSSVCPVVPMTSSLPAAAQARATPGVTA